MAEDLIYAKLWFYQLLLCDFSTGDYIARRGVILLIISRFWCKNVGQHAGNDKCKMNF